VRPRPSDDLSARSPFRLSRRVFRRPAGRMHPAVRHCGSGRRRLASVTGTDRLCVIGCVRDVSSMAIGRKEKRRRDHRRQQATDCCLGGFTYGPWPSAPHKHQEVTLQSRAERVFELPSKYRVAPRKDNFSLVGSESRIRHRRGVPEKVHDAPRGALRGCLASRHGVTAHHLLGFPICTPHTRV